MIKSPLRYPGGKSRAIKQILPHIPLNIREYREPFLGGGSVYLAVHSTFKLLVSRYWVNDLNYDLYCFWCAVQNNLDLLVTRIWELRHAFTDGRLLYLYLKEGDHQTELDRAVRFFVLNRITFSGVADAGGYSEQAYEKRFTGSSIQRLAKLAGSFTHTRITHSDYENALLQEGDDVFIFLDPPYLSTVGSRLYGVRGSLHTEFDHQRFAALMRGCPHRWLITYDDSPEIRDLFSFAKIIEWELQYGMNNFTQGVAAKGKELLIKNY